jgi:hypothetical protein
MVNGKVKKNAKVRWPPTRVIIKRNAAPHKMMQPAYSGDTQLVAILCYANGAEDASHCPSALKYMKVSFLLNNSSIQTKN